MKKTLSQFFGTLAALAAVAVAIYVVIQNLGKIRGFCEDHCPWLLYRHSDEYSDYVE